MLLLAFAAVPAMLIVGILVIAKGELEKAFQEPLKQMATTVGDTIDRNLFERYGDVQAFGLNTAAIDPANWGKPGNQNPLVRSMNGYMTGYGIYRAMLLLDLQGNVVAVNSVDPVGQPLDTAGLYGMNFSTSNWFQKAIGGDFLQGSNGLTGTAVEQPAEIDFIASLYGDDGYVITFAAPVYDASGKAVAIWANFADFGLVEEIVAGFYNQLAADGMVRSEITVLDPKGNVIVDYDPVGQGWTDYRRNPEVIGKLNLVKLGVGSASDAVAGRTGAREDFHARKQVLLTGGFAHTDGAYGYPGLDWSVLVRTPAAEAYQVVTSVAVTTGIALAVALAVLAGLGILIGRSSVAPIRKLTEAMAKLADGDKAADIPGTDRGG